MKDIYIISGCRTAIGSFGGSLKDISVSDLGAIVIKETINRAEISPNLVDEVLIGCILTAAQGQNVARQSALKSGLPIKTPCSTVGMVCGSGMKSVIDAARAISCDDAEIVLAGGMENMSAASYSIPTARWGARMNNATLIDTLIHDALWDAFNDYHMGETAEKLCEQWGITREEQDAYALKSQQKATSAQAQGKFIEEIVPVEIKRKKETILFEADEYIRPESTLEGLEKLRPAFRKDGGRVTAGNASGINDGAAALLLASGEAVEKHNLNPIVKLVGWGQSGVDPSIMGIGPVYASRNALKKANMSIQNMDLIEANEAFAAQSLAVARELNFDMDKVNVNGGAIALGHPVGASGARIIVTLIHEMRRRKAKHGLATLCIGGGMGIASIFELC
jgi:acetyl-CoA C-acetyltransferase